MVLLAGCGPRVKVVTDLPVNVSEQQAKTWDSEVGNLHKIADTMKTLRTGLGVVHNSSDFLSDEYYYKALTAIGHVDQYILEADRYLQEQPKLFGTPQQQKLKSEMGLISAELMTLTNINATGVKSDGSKTMVGQMIAEITSTVNLILSFQF